MHIANDKASTARLRHALRRYLTLQERVRNGLIVVGHVRDAANPSDFLTKLIPSKKLEDSVAYGMGAPYNGRTRIQQCYGLCPLRGCHVTETGLSLGCQIKPTMKSCSSPPRLQRFHVMFAFLSTWSF